MSLFSPLTQSKLNISYICSLISLTFHQCVGTFYYCCRSSVVSWRFFVAGLRQKVLILFGLHESKSMERWNVFQKKYLENNVVVFTGLRTFCAFMSVARHKMKNKERNIRRHFTMQYVECKTHRPLEITIIPGESNSKATNTAGKKEDATPHSIHC